MKRLVWNVAVILSLNGTAASAGDTRPPERRIEGTTITSQRDPAVKITLPAAAKYVGGSRWDLYGICDAELHVFVEADDQKRVQRLYWVQFEGYLPDNTHTYQYPFSETTRHGGREWDVTVSFVPTGQPARAGSDTERVRLLLEQSGYTLGAEAQNVRLVNLLDDAKRKELMFIYGEDLGPSGITAAELDEPGHKARKEDMKAALIERAKQRIQVEF